MKNYVLIACMLSSATLLAQHSADSLEIVSILKSDYETRASYDLDKHKRNLTDQFMLLENGEIWDLERDSEWYRANANRNVARKDYFNIHTVRVYGDIAYVVYELVSEFTSNNALRGKHWLESAIFRKINGAWKLELLHSSRVDLKG